MAVKNVNWIINLWHAKPKLKNVLKYIKGYGFKSTLQYSLVRIKEISYLNQAEMPSEEYTAKIYQAWAHRHYHLSKEDKSCIIHHINCLSHRPLLSIIMPVYDTPIIFLKRAINSVLKQLYPHWELCIVDDASSNKKIRTLLNRYAKIDKRIKTIFSSHNAGIASASNTALSLANGSHVGFLDHDDELSEHALYWIAVELNREPMADIIYTDEDHIDEFGRARMPHFKSDWNEQLFYAQNYLNHLTIYRRKLIEEVGGFRLGYEGSQDHDLALRVIGDNQKRKIIHIPAVLYHWRITQQQQRSFSQINKNKAQAAAKQAVADYLHSHSKDVEIIDWHPSHNGYRLCWPLPKPEPQVSLLIPTRDQVKLLKNCLEGLLKRTDYSNLEIIIIDNDSQEAETLSYLNLIKADPRIKIYHYPGAFNFSAMNNYAVRQARGTIIGFINNDIEVIHPSWLKEMVSYLSQPGVATVGAKLLYANNTIQHAGVIIGIGGVAGHSHKHFSQESHGYFSRLWCPQELTAVTAACMLVNKSCFDEVGGFDEVNLKVAFNDVDLCLKFRAAGYKVIWTPYAELYHLESVSRGHDIDGEKALRFQQEVNFMIKKWFTNTYLDPYYNPNLSMDNEDFSLAFIPRVKKPWKQLFPEIKNLTQANSFVCSSANCSG